MILIMMKKISNNKILKLNFYDNLKIIFFILGILISVLGIAMLIPLVTNFIYQETFIFFYQAC